MKKYITYVKEIIKGHITHKRIPILITLCVTNKCNLRCIYCYAEYYERNYREFTTQEILNLIDELVSMGTKYISINGGESLLRADICTIVDKIKEKNILEGGTKFAKKWLSLVTKGTFLTLKKFQLSLLFMIYSFENFTTMCFCFCKQSYNFTCITQVTYDFC